MDIVEFAERLCGCKLPYWQKEVLKLIDALPPDHKLVYCGGTWHIINERNCALIISDPRCRGLHPRIYIIDEEKKEKEKENA